METNFFRSSYRNKQVSIRLLKLLVLGGYDHDY
jgi:hypothetical protein